MIAAATRRDIARAYAFGKPVKIIAYEFGVSRKYVPIVARMEGVPSRLNGRPSGSATIPDTLGDEILALFKAGLDATSIAARLKIRTCEAANELARARDQERQQ